MAHARRELLSRFHLSNINQADQPQTSDGGGDENGVGGHQMSASLSICSAARAETVAGRLISRISQ